MVIFNTMRKFTIFRKKKATFYLRKSVMILGYVYANTYMYCYGIRDIDISPWRHVLITAPYQNNIIIPATPRLSPRLSGAQRLLFVTLFRARQRKLLTRVN